MSEDQTIRDLKAYKEGYKDGYNDAVKFYVINPYLNTHHDHSRAIANAYNKIIGSTGSTVEYQYPKGSNGGIK